MKDAANAERLALMEREIVLSRVFDAPRELVFKAWTEREQVSKWFGPQGFTTTTHEMSAQVGGRWRFDMRAPDGTVYTNRVVYLEVSYPSRLVFEHGSDQDDDPSRFHVTVTFDEQSNGKTVITMRQLHPTKVRREWAVGFGAVEFGYQTLEKLANHVSAAKAALPRFTTERTFNAPRALVFAAWASPSALSRWFPPDGLTMENIQMEFRAGGPFRFDFRDPGGADFPFVGAFREIITNEKIVFAGRVGPDLDAVTTLLFEETDGKTTLKAEQVYSGENESTRGAPIGWGQTLDHLAAFLAS